MARLSISRRPAAPVASQTDQLNAELGQLLNRLQHAILYVDPKTERRLRTSEIERTKTNKNIAYARSVLTKLEQESLGLKAHILRQDLQADLNQKREVLDVLIDRMQDLEQMATHTDDDDDDSDFDGEDVLAGIIPTPSESMDSGSVDHGWEQDAPGELDAPSPPPAEPGARVSAPSPTPQPPTQTSHEPPATTPTATLRDTTTTTTTSTAPSTAGAPAEPTSTDQTLRPRRAPYADSDSAHTTARATLLSPRRRTAPSSSTARKDDGKHSTLTAEALLDRQRTEQEALVSGILTYASALKSSSQRFHDALERDKEALGRAAEGMDRTETGMQAAKRRVNVLARMTEGKGWWGRIMLFAWVYGLMVVLVLVVFVLPKLRF